MYVKNLKILTLKKNFELISSVDIHFLLLITYLENFKCIITNQFMCSYLEISKLDLGHKQGYLEVIY